MSFMKYVYWKVVIYVMMNFKNLNLFPLYFFTMSEGSESTGGCGSSMAMSGLDMDPDVVRKINYDTLCYLLPCFLETFSAYFEIFISGRGRSVEPQSTWPQK